MTEVIKDLTHDTLGLIRIMGLLMETEDLSLFQEAKNIAQKMASTLEMPEAGSAISAVKKRKHAKIIRDYIMSVGSLAKTCEAWDHFENFPYRQTFERHIRIILSL